MKTYNLCANPAISWSFNTSFLVWGIIWITSLWSFSTDGFLRVVILGSVLLSIYKSKVHVINILQVTYGTFVADPQDQQSLTAMIEYFISPNAVKRDFEFTKSKHSFLYTNISVAD